jgi:IBR domain, a half RING-finger domain
MATAVDLGHFDELDDVTAALIYQLQLEDSQQLLGNSQGELEVTGDTRFALEVALDEAHRRQNILRDHQIAQLISQGVEPNEAVRRLTTPTITARESADADIVQVEGVVDIIAPNTGPANIDYELAVQGAPLWGENESTVSAEEAAETESTASDKIEGEGEGESKTGIETNRCTSCMERIPVDSIIVVPCGHGYCQDCLLNLFSRSFIDEELFPPRCCRQPILLENLQASLTPEIAQAYEAKKIEFESTDRTYCCASECSAFLSPASIQDGVAECSLCQTRTCTLCKTAAHNGDCPDDENSRLLQELAAREGWQTCPSCHRMVELTVGCYHMMLVFPSLSSIVTLTVLDVSVT